MNSVGLRSKIASHLMFLAITFALIAIVSSQFIGCAGGGSVGTAHEVTAEGRFAVVRGQQLNLRVEEEGRGDENFDIVDNQGKFTLPLPLIGDEAAVIVTGDVRQNNKVIVVADLVPFNVPEEAASIKLELSLEIKDTETAKVKLDDVKVTATRDDASSQSAQSKSSISNASSESRSSVQSQTSQGQSSSTGLSANESSQASSAESSANSIIPTPTPTVPPCPPYSRGDMNCDCQVNREDSVPLVLAINDPQQYQSQYPNCDVNLADVNGDGQIDFFDIDAFEQLVQ